jgi:ABC-type lipoprotein release transport system permease subunit
MLQSSQKQGWLASMSPIKRTILGLSIIALIVVLGVIYGPHYDVDNTTTGDTPQSAVIVNHSLGVLNVNRSLIYQGVTITITNVEQATSFSDDNKSAYAHVKYIVRVRVHVQAPAKQQGAVGIDYGNLANLTLADGTQLEARLSQISPDVLPNTQQDGFLDFWVNTPLNLSALTFNLDGNSIVF